MRGAKILPFVGIGVDAVLFFIALCAGKLFDPDWSYWLIGAMVGVLVLCCCTSVLCYNLGMILIGLGQIAQNTAPPITSPSATVSNAKKTKTAEVETVKEEPAKKAPAPTENSYEEEFWLCGKCKTKNLNSREDCWSCGNKK